MADFYTPPWIEPGQTKLEDVGAELVNSWAKGVQQKLQSQQHEEAIRRLDLAIKNQENLQEYRNSMLGIDQQRADEAHEDRQDAIEVRRDRLNEQNDLKARIREQQGNLNSGISDIDLNDPDAYSQILDLEADNSDGAMTTAWNAKRNAFLNRYNNNATKQGQAFNQDYRTWMAQQRALYADYPGDFSGVINRGSWNQQYAVYNPDGTIAKTKDAKGNATDYYVDPSNPALYPKLKEGQYVAPTANWYVPFENKDKSTGYYTRPASTVQKTIDDYKGYQERRSKLPQQISAPGHGIYPQSSPYGPAVDLKELSKRALNDPNALPIRKAQARKHLGLNPDGSEDDTVNSGEEVVDTGDAGDTGSY